MQGERGRRMLEQSRPRKRAASISFEEDEAADAAYEAAKRAREAAEMRKRGSRLRIRTYGSKSTTPAASVVRVIDPTHPEALEERRQEALAKARAARDVALAEAMAQQRRSSSQQQQQQQQEHLQQQQQSQEEEQRRHQSEGEEAEKKRSGEEEALAARAKARAGLQAADMCLEEAPPPPPVDAVQQQVIDLLASFVTRNGGQFEEMARQRKAQDTFFSFLRETTSAGAVYYAWKKEELLKQEEVEEYSQLRAAMPGKLGLAGTVGSSKPKRKRVKYFGAVPDKEEEIFRARMRDLSSAGGNAEKIALTPLPEMEKPIASDNVGRRMMERLGWQEGSGLGAGGDGRVKPVDAGSVKLNSLGVGADNPNEMRNDDDLYAVYKKRKIAAYKNRPNPYK